MLYPTPPNTKLNHLAECMSWLGLLALTSTACAVAPANTAEHVFANKRAVTNTTELSVVVAAKSQRHDCLPAQHVRPADDLHPTAWYPVECKRGNPGPSGVDCHTRGLDIYCTISNAYVPDDGSPEISETQLTSGTFNDWLSRQIASARSHLKSGQALAGSGEVFAWGGPQKSPWLHNSVVGKAKYSLTVYNVMAVADAPAFTAALVNNHPEYELDEAKAQKAGIPLEWVAAPAILYGEFGFTAVQASALEASAGGWIMSAETLSMLARGTIARTASASFQIHGLLTWLFPPKNGAIAYHVLDAYTYGDTTHITPATPQDTITSGDWDDVLPQLATHALELTNAIYATSTTNMLVPDANGIVAYPEEFAADIEAAKTESASANCHRGYRGVRDTCNATHGGDLQDDTRQAYCDYLAAGFLKGCRMAQSAGNAPFACQAGFSSCNFYSMITPTRDTFWESAPTDPRTTAICAEGMNKCQ